MRYNKEQLEIAEYIIKSIKDNDSCMDINLLKYDLQAKYGYEKGYDRAMIVMHFLEEDKVIEYWGKRYVKLTSEGCEVAHYGLRTYNEAVKWYNRSIKVREVPALLIAVATLVALICRCS